MNSKIFFNKTYHNFIKICTNCTSYTIKHLQISKNIYEKWIPYIRRTDKNDTEKFQKNIFKKWHKLIVVPRTSVYSSND
mgnify:CR=1 FL=1